MTRLSAEAVAMRCSHYVGMRLKTHSGMLPQSRTLEVSAADKLRGMYETGGNIKPYVNIAEGRFRRSRLRNVTSPVRGPKREGG